MKLMELLGKKNNTKSEVALVIFTLGLTLYQLVPQLINLYKNYPEFNWSIYTLLLLGAIVVEFGMFFYTQKVSTPSRRKITIGLIIVCLVMIVMIVSNL